MYFSIKNYLKNNCYHTAKHTSNSVAYVFSNKIKYIWIDFFHVFFLYIFSALIP
jgi:hypothetical protein